MIHTWMCGVDKMLVCYGINMLSARRRVYAAFELNIYVNEANLDECLARRRNQRLTKYTTTLYSYCPLGNWPAACLHRRLIAIRPAFTPRRTCACTRLDYLCE